MLSFSLDAGKKHRCPFHSVSTGDCAPGPVGCDQDFKGKLLMPVNPPVIYPVIRNPTDRGLEPDSAPAFAAASAISRSSMPRSTTKALGVFASMTSACPAPDTTRATGHRILERVPGNGTLIESSKGQETGTLHRIPDACLFFKTDHRKPVLRTGTAAAEPAGPHLRQQHRRPQAHPGKSGKIRSTGGIFFLLLSR